MNGCAQCLAFGFEKSKFSEHPGEVGVRKENISPLRDLRILQVKQIICARGNNHWLVRCKEPPTPSRTHTRTHTHIHRGAFLEGQCKWFIPRWKNNSVTPGIGFTRAETNQDLLLFLIFYQYFIQPNPAEASKMLCGDFKVICGFLEPHTNARNPSPPTKSLIASSQFTVTFVLIFLGQFGQFTVTSLSRATTEMKASRPFSGPPMAKPDALLLWCHLISGKTPTVLKMRFHRLTGNPTKCSRKENRNNGSAPHPDDSILSALSHSCSVSPP